MERTRATREPGVGRGVPSAAAAALLLSLAGAVAAEDPDTTAPVGRITSPAAGSCLGPAAVPVAIEDDFVDDRDPVPTRTYTPAATRQRRIDTPSDLPDSFGFSIALDGDLMVVGAPSYDRHGGRTLVFRKTGNDWPLEFSFYRGSWPNSGFLGWDVAAEGDRFVTGAPFTFVRNRNWAGRAHGLVRLGARWTRSFVLNGDGPQEFQEFGKSVAVSGEWTAIGAPAEDVFGIRSAGAVYIRRAGYPGFWQKLVFPDRDRDAGFGVVLSMDGSVLAVGSLRVIVLYRLHGETWIEEAVLRPETWQSARAGFSLDVSGDRLVVGFRFDRARGLRAGVAHVFERHGGAWTEVATLYEPGAEDLREFGARVAVEGNTIAVAAVRDDERGPESGSVYLYERNPSGWIPTRKLFAADGAMNDRFGTGLAIDGQVIAAGAPGKHQSFEMVKGKLYLFEPIQDPSYDVHGNHRVTLEVEDTAGNRAGDSVEFVIDLLPPDLTVISPPKQELLDDRPFDIVFEADDEDVANGDVVHEVVFLQGCPAFDGLRYGDGDGLLRDEILHVGVEERCRIADECGLDVLAEVELRFEVRDCGANVTAVTRNHPGGPLRLRTEACGD